MTNPTTPVSDALYGYMLAMGVREAPVLQALREETLQLSNGGWAVTPEQASFLQLLVRLMGAERILEVGTFTGYSTLALALALPEDGRVVTCDVASGWSEMGTHYWRDAGVEKRIDRRLGRAEEIMAEIRDSGGGNRFDMIFLDADKRSYPTYLELSADLLRPGGLLVADDVFWRGEVVNAGNEEDQAAGVHAFNARLRDDLRFDIAMIPIADGMTLARKK